MKIHYFFNGDDCQIAEHDLWNNHVNPDSAKLALFCAESWRRNGWDPVRMVCDPPWIGPEDIQSRSGPYFRFNGLLGKYGAQNGDWYPYWNFWFSAWKICMLNGPSWFTTIDVFNYGFTPVWAEKIRDEAAVALLDCVTLQNQHFSASLLYITTDYCLKAIRIIEEYDAGNLPILETERVSDETILRSYSKYFHYSLCKYYGVEKGWETAPLIHMPRSVLKRMVG